MPCRRRSCLLVVEGHMLTSVSATALFVFIRYAICRIAPCCFAPGTTLCRVVPNTFVLLRSAVRCSVHVHVLLGSERCGLSNTGDRWMLDSNHMKEGGAG